MYNIQEEEDRNFIYSSAAEVDRFDVELGAYNSSNTTSAWICSDRDVWYRNPYYTGAPAPHPESYEAEYADEIAAEALEESNREIEHPEWFLNADQSGEIPF